MNQREEVYLIHIVEAYARLSSYLPKTKEEFLADYSKQDAAIRRNYDRAKF